MSKIVSVYSTYYYSLTMCVCSDTVGWVFTSTINLQKIPLQQSSNISLETSGGCCDEYSHSVSEMKFLTLTDHDRNYSVTHLEK